MDDNRDAAETLARLLASLGHEVRAAFDGPRPWRSPAEFRPDIVFLDIGMPGMSGYEAARSSGPSPI